MDFDPNDDPFGDHPGRPDKRVVRYPPKKRMKVISSSSEGNIEESHGDENLQNLSADEHFERQGNPQKLMMVIGSSSEGNIQESHGDENPQYLSADEHFERQGNPQKLMIVIGSSNEVGSSSMSNLSKSLEKHYLEMSGVKGNPIAIFFDGFYGSMGWLIESGENQNITLNKKFVDFQFSGLFRLGESSEERIRVLKRIREACSSSKICYICVPIHFEIRNRVTIQADILSSGFAACLFVGFRHSMVAGFYLEYRPFITDNDSFFLFVQADESSMLASFGKYTGYLDEIWTVCSLFDRCLPTSPFDPIPTRFDEVNANYLGILMSFLEKFAKVCSKDYSVPLSRTNVIVVGGAFSSREMLLESLRERFPKIPIMKYNLETIVKGILVGGLGLGNKCTGKTPKVLEINFVRHIWGDLLCMSCGMAFGGSELDARMFSQVDGSRLDLRVGEDDVELEVGVDDEDLDVWVGDDEELDVGEADEELVVGQADAEDDEEFEDNNEEDVEEEVKHPSVDYCQGCHKPVCTRCEKSGCQVCKNKDGGQNS